MKKIVSIILTLVMLVSILGESGCFAQQDIGNEGMDKSITKNIDIPKEDFAKNKSVFFEILRSLFSAEDGIENLILRWIFCVSVGALIGGMSLWALLNIGVSAMLCFKPKIFISDKLYAYLFPEKYEKFEFFARFKNERINDEKKTSEKLNEEIKKLETELQKIQDEENWLKQNKQYYDLYKSQDHPFQILYGLGRIKSFIELINKMKKKEEEKNEKNDINCFSCDIANRSK